MSIVKEIAGTSTTAPWRRPGKAARGGYASAERLFGHLAADAIGHGRMAGEQAVADAIASGEEIPQRGRPTTSGLARIDSGRISRTKLDACVQSG